MTVEELEYELLKLGSHMVSRGFEMPRAIALIYSGGDTGLLLESIKGGDTIRTVDHHAKGATLAEKLADAMAWIERQPSRTQADAREKVAAAIAACQRAGLDMSAEIASQKT